MDKLSNSSNASGRPLVTDGDHSLSSTSSATIVTNQLSPHSPQHSGNGNVFDRRDNAIASSDNRTVITVNSGSSPDAASDHHQQLMQYFNHRHQSPVTGTVNPAASYENITHFAASSQPTRPPEPMIFDHIDHFNKYHDNSDQKVLGNQASSLLDLPSNGTAHSKHPPPKHSNSSPSSRRSQVGAWICTKLLLVLCLIILLGVGFLGGFMFAQCKSLQCHSKVLETKVPRLHHSESV